MRNEFPIVYHLGKQSFEMLSDSVSKAIATIATRPTGGCDTKSFAVFMVRRDGRWQTNMVIEVVEQACKRAS